MAWDGDKEIEVYNFSKVCKLDNRFLQLRVYILDQQKYLLNLLIN